MQHMEYPKQLEQKKAALANAIGDCPVEVVSGAEYGYRNRMDFIFHSGGLGLRARGQWDRIIDVRRCRIADERINALLEQVRGAFPRPDFFDIKKRSGTFRYAIIRTSDEESSISFVLSPKSSRLSQAIESIKSFAQESSAQNVLVTYVPQDTEESVSSDYFVVKGSDLLHKAYLGKRFSYSVQAFFQNNHTLAERMQEYCRDVLSSFSCSEAHLLDLYGGVGTFGIVDADLFKGVTIVESAQPAVEAAKRNIAGNGIKNASAVLMDAKNLVRLDLPSPLFVITDPPRSGMDQKTIHTLNTLRPEAMVYISCNVHQLKKDLMKLKRYRVARAALFDLFPQTPHSEAIVLLEPLPAEKGSAA